MFSLREHALNEGEISSAIKAVTVAAIYTSIRCLDCVHGYLVVAHQLGATSDQVREMMNLVTMSQGCTGEVWAAKACTFFESLVEGKVDLSSDSYRWCLELTGKIR